MEMPEMGEDGGGKFTLWLRKKTSPNWKSI